MKAKENIFYFYN